MTDITYEPAYSPSQEARLAFLHPCARPTFIEVLAAIQRADEVGGPEGDEYLRLMDAVIEEAKERRTYCRDYTMA